jgi:hypothetical protein
MRKKLSIILAIGLISSASVAQAIPTIFFDEDTSTAASVTGTDSEAMRNTFLSTLTGVGNEDFESFAAGTTTPSLTFPGSSGSITASLTGATCVDNSASTGCGGSNPGRWATSGDQFWETSSGGAFSIDFSSAVSAFGFYGTDIGDFDNQLVITLTDTGGGTTDFTVGHSLGLSNTANSLLFWGFQDLDTAYTSIAFSNSGSGGDVFAFDDMVIGDREQIAVPEPSIIMLLSIGLAGIGFARRRTA